MAVFSVSSPESLTQSQEDALIGYGVPIRDDWKYRNSTVSNTWPASVVFPAGSLPSVVSSGEFCQGVPVIWDLFFVRVGSVAIGYSSELFSLTLVTVPDQQNGIAAVWESAYERGYDDNLVAVDDPLFRLTLNGHTAVLTAKVESAAVPSQSVTWMNLVTWDCFGSNLFYNVGGNGNFSVAVAPRVFSDVQRTSMLSGRDSDLNQALFPEVAVPLAEIGSLSGIIV